MSDLDWKDGRTPVSKRFDDIYYAHEDGLEESRYIFLDGNKFSERLRAYNHSNPESQESAENNLKVAELGFGTGLNFVTSLIEAARQVQKNRIIYYSVEKYPITPEDMRKALSFWPETEIYSSALASLFQALQPNWNSLFFEKENVELRLFYGDVTDFLKEDFEGVDAWYLDGHSPRKNPEMWSEAVLLRIGEKTREGGSFSTFASAGHVRRNLQAAGFNVQKRAGFGRKRDSLVGIKRHAPGL